MVEKEISRSRALAAKVIFAALKTIKESGGQLPAQDVLEKVQKNVELDD
ncbi:MAG: hypothetical protein HQM10_11725 [Candidatus Riflebacteria bacterium]|nr:hypothetical protein [Candidatus Riflebacteria bacterium]